MSVVAQFVATLSVFVFQESLGFYGKASRPRAAEVAPVHELALAPAPEAPPLVRYWDDYLATEPTPLDPEECLDENPESLFGRLSEHLNLSLREEPAKDAATRAAFLAKYFQTLATHCERSRPHAEDLRPAFREIYDFTSAAFARAPRARAGLEGSQQEAYVARAFANAVAGQGGMWASNLKYTAEDTAGYIRARLILAGSRVPAAEMDLFRGELAAKLRRFSEQVSPENGAGKELYSFLVIYAQSYQLGPDREQAPDVPAADAAEPQLWTDYLAKQPLKLDDCLAHAPAELFHVIGRRDRVSTYYGSPGRDSPMVDGFYRKYAQTLSSYNEQRFPDRVMSREAVRELFYYTFEGLRNGYGMRSYINRERIDAYIEYLIATVPEGGDLPGAKELDFSAGQAAGYARARLVMLGDQVFGLALEDYRAGVLARIQAAEKTGPFGEKTLSYLITRLADDHQSPLEPLLGAPGEDL